MAYFFQGLTIGLAYVAPIGMQNLFVIFIGIGLLRTKTQEISRSARLLYDFFLLIRGSY